MKRCKVCKADFVPSKPMQSVCSVPCALSMAAIKKAKRARQEATADKRETRIKLEALKTRGEWLAEAKRAIQKYRRLAELANGEGCISCGRSQKDVQATDGWKPGGAWDGGHYLGKGARPELALEPLNIWLQCKSCNAGSGKYARKGYTVNASFRENLIARIGLAQVEWLEGPHAAKRYSIDDLKAIKATYAAKCRELENARG